jgi:hypothetical protein
MTWFSIRRPAERCRGHAGHGQPGCEGVTAVVKAEVGDLGSFEGGPPFPLPVPQKAPSRGAGYVRT